MDVLRQAYPEVEDAFLESALYDGHGDVFIALELLRNDMGEPNDGSNVSKEIYFLRQTEKSSVEKEDTSSYGKGLQRIATPTVETESSKSKSGTDVDDVVSSME